MMTRQPSCIQCQVGSTSRQCSVVLCSRVMGNLRGWPSGVGQVQRMPMAPTSAPALGGEKHLDSLSSAPDRSSSAEVNASATFAASWLVSATTVRSASSCACNSVKLLLPLPCTVSDVTGSEVLLLSRFAA
jgi:hypothetical protein